MDTTYTRVLGVVSPLSDKAKRSMHYSRGCKSYFTLHSICLSVRFIQLDTWLDFVIILHFKIVSGAMESCTVRRSLGQAG